MDFDLPTGPPPAYTRGDVTFAQVTKDLDRTVELGPEFRDALIAFQQFLVSQERGRLSKYQVKLLRSQAVHVLEECARYKSKGGDLSIVLPVVNEIFTGVSEQIEQGPRWDQVIMDPTVIRKLESTIGDAVDRLEDQIRRMARGEDAESTMYKDELARARANDRKKIEELESVIRGLLSSTQSPNLDKVVDNSMEENLKIIGDPSGWVGQKQIDARKSLAVIAELTGKSLPPNTMLDRKFVTIGNHAINQGSTYDVFLGEYFTGEKIAIKVLRHRVDEETATKTHMRFGRLTENWSALRHDCILPFYGVGVMQSPVSPTEYQLYLVSPYLKNQDITLDIARGLEYMHEGDDLPELESKGMVHGALNIYNVLVKDSGRAVISGFGHAKVIKDFQTSFTGDYSEYRYTGPEVLDDAVLTFGSDIWSWAMISLEILTDEPPFGAKTRGTKIIKWIASYQRPQRANHPKIEQYEHKDEIWQLFEDCWTKHPEDRPSAREVVQRFGPLLRFHQRYNSNIQKPPESPYQKLEYGRRDPVFQHQFGRKPELAQSQNPLSSAGEPEGKENQEGSETTPALEPGLSTKPNMLNHPPSEQLKQKVGGRMSISEVVALISLRGLPNLTSEVDAMRCTTNPFAGGGFGDVYRGYLRNGLKVAIKCPRIFGGSPHEERNTWAMAKEGYTWSKHKHPNILESCGIAEFRDRIALISPWMDNGTVMDYIVQHPNVDRPKLCAQVACGLAYLHSMETIHGDIKGANVLVALNGVARLTDFGSTILKHYSVVFSGDQATGLSTRWAVWMDTILPPN
ncbi:unnamed protein product [Rhizoctonia solani]|uniref:Protein kinase domain-containing protein n=1 Tax=Rhizoctonia solani TaxID=456999 RepID=A0A8H3HHY8_9AGAM|nr:unnamed protein product [Rhizoctonia solani]